jgi:hypothetical protein
MDAIPMRRKGIKKKRGKERFCLGVCERVCGWASLQRKRFCSLD